MSARWHEFTAAELRRGDEPLVETYDQICDVAGFGVAARLRCRQPIGLVKKRHLAIFDNLNSSREERMIEVDEPLLACLVGHCDLNFVQSTAAIRRVVNAHVRMVGRDPRGKYPQCTSWYARRIHGRARARVLIRMPLVEQRAKREEQGRAARRGRRRILRL